MDRVLKKCIVAGVLIINKEGDKVLLVKHRKLGVWIYPGGHLEDGENPLECAIRESKEETNSTFKILSTDELSISEEGAKSLPQPLIIMDEIVPYSNGPHEHFDLIYIGVADNLEFRSNDESSDCRWFNRNEIESLETFDNVKKIIEKGFEAFSRITGMA